jgi:hypothetical protein
MIRRPWLAAVAAAATATVPLVSRPEFADLAELARFAARPLMVPLAFEAIADSRLRGTPAETYARAQQLLQWLPQWLDGHTVFAYRYAIEGGDLAAPHAERATAAAERLWVALGALHAARPLVGRREVELLETMAILPEAAVRAEPGVDVLLQPHGGAARLADELLALAEARGAGPAVRERRTFRAVGYAASLLAAGNRNAALQVLELAIQRAGEVRDASIAGPWRDRLREIHSHLRGEAVDLTAVAADPRMADLLPHLR